MGVYFWLSVVIYGTLACSTLVGMTVAVQTWQRRATVGRVAVAFSILCLCSSQWAFCYLFELATAYPPLKFFWYSFKQLGIDLILPMLLLFVLYYNGPTLRLRAWQVVLIFAEPATIILLFATNGWHHLIVKGYNVRPYLGFTVLEPILGDVDAMDGFYSLFFFAGVLALLVAHYIRAPRFFRPPLRLILIGIIITAVGSIVSGFNLIHQYFDLSPLFLIVTLPLFEQSIRRYRMFSVAPIARDLIFDQMEEGVVLLNPDAAVMDINKAATRIVTQVGRTVTLGEHVDHLLPAPVNMEILQRDQQTRLPLTLESGSRYILFRLSPLESETAGTQGLLILLSDITDQVLAQQELEVSRASLETAYRQLESTNQKLEQQIALVQQQAAQLEGANAELQRKRSTERDIGARVQQSLLVPSAPQDLPGVRIASLSVPSQQVDGDFCDFYTHSDLVFDLVVGDVMGKGLSAALLGAATKTQILRSVNYLMSRSISPALPTPETLVQQTHRWITPNLIQLDTFVTLTYARFDLKRELATLVDCGHTSTIHYRAETGECCLLTGKGLPLGVLEEETYCQFDVPIAPGDLFIFYSDGITEARNRQGQMYGIERLQALIGRHALESPASITEVLHQELDRFTGATHFADDVTCIVVAIDTTGQLQGWHETEAVLDPVFVTEAMLQQLSSSALWGSLRN